MDKKYYIELLDSFMRGNTSGEEESILFDWFEADGSEEEIQSLYKERWENSSNTLDENIQLKMLNNIRSQIDDRMRKEARTRMRFKQYIAVACMLLVVVAGTYFFAQEWLYPPKEFVVAAGMGEKTSLRLPDSTMAWLNADSRLRYDSRYNRKNRRVVLEGEAYFDVAKNKDLRFIVSANDLDIEALGTSFNVKSYSGDENVVVSLVEGKLKVSTTEAEKLLHPNERLTFNKQNKGITISDKFNMENAGKWRNNELVFNEESLEEIATTLTRMYDMKIVFTPETAKRYTFSGTIKNNSPGNVLEIISLAAPIQYTIEDGVVEIRDK